MSFFIGTAFGLSLLGSSITTAGMVNNNLLALGIGSLMIGFFGGVFALNVLKK
jgi:hypothetical protein